MQRNAEPKEILHNPKQVIQASHEAAFWLVSPITEASALRTLKPCLHHIQSQKAAEMLKAVFIAI